MIDIVNECARGGVLEEDLLPEVDSLRYVGWYGKVCRKFDSGLRSCCTEEKHVCQDKHDVSGHFYFRI